MGTKHAFLTDSMGQKPGNQIGIDYFQKGRQGPVKEAPAPLVWNCLPSSEVMLPAPPSNDLLELGVAHRILVSLWWTAVPMVDGVKSKQNDDGYKHTPRARKQVESRTHQEQGESI